MALVAAKCMQCGASIEVDDSKEAGVCRHWMSKPPTVSVRIE